MKGEALEDEMRTKGEDEPDNKNKKEDDKVSDNKQEEDLQELSEVWQRLDAFSERHGTRVTDTVFMQTAV